MYKDVQYRIIYHKVIKKLICSKMNYSFSIKWKIAQSLKIMFLKKKKENCMMWQKPCFIILGDK